MIKRYYIIALCAIGISSCDYLAYDESNGVTQEDTFAYFSNIKSLVATVYSGLYYDYGTISGAMRESASDNSVYTWSSNSIYDMYNDSWSALNTIDDQWDEMYTYIRRANSFLENYSEEALDKFIWDASYQESILQCRMYIHEVRVLRAYFHFELAKRYGDVIIADRCFTQQEANDLTASPFSEVIDFVVSEIDDVLAQEDTLPLTQADFYNETGRLTKGAALAIKARALLYAASPLHNPDNDKALWQKAAEAAKQVIDLGVYELVPIASDPLYSVDGANDVLSSKQLILERRATSASNTFEAYNLPIGFEGGNSGNTPTQNLVDAYEFADGTIFDWNNSEHVKNIYTNRDPRFELNILANGREYMSQTVETYVGGANGSPIEGASMTGYYLRKLMNETVSLSTSSPVYKLHHFPLYRYVEVLLNYAEAMAQWKGADDTSLTLTAREALNQVRTAAGMPSVTATGDQFLERVYNERRVELAFEDHRFWDIRRWMIGDQIENIYGVKIASSGATAEKILVQQRIWKEKMYLYPLAQTELYNNSNLEQNSGW